MSQLVKQSLSNQIYELLRGNIIDQTFACGEKLNVRELQQKYNISSTPIREAINRLQQEGLVEYATNIGAKVIDIHEKDIVEIQDLCIVLDSSAIKFAMQRENKDIIAAELLKHIEGQRNSGQDHNETFHALQFHEVFYRFADNSRLTAAAQQIKGQQSILRNKYSGLESKTKGLEEHLKIYKAVLQGDAEKSVQYMKEHHESAKQLLLANWPR